MALRLTGNQSDPISIRRSESVADKSPAAGDPVSQNEKEISGGSSPTQDSSTEAEFVGKATEILRPLLRDPAQAPKAAAAVVLASVEMFSGPLPHPQHLARYESLIPGSGRDILRMAMGEQSHRHKMQTLEMVYPYLGWFSGSVGFLICVAGAVYLGTIGGHDILAAAMLGVPVVGVIGWFINARISLSRTSAPPGPAPNKPSGNRNSRRKPR